MKIPADEQILAILQAKEGELAAKYGVTAPNEITWSISKVDVKRYIAENGFPGTWVHFREQSFDGVYLLPANFEWKVCYQERGLIHYEERFPSKEEAMDYLLDEYYLKRKQIA